MGFSDSASVSSAFSTVARICVGSNATTSSKYAGLSLLAKESAIIPVSGSRISSSSIHSHAVMIMAVSSFIPFIASSSSDSVCSSSDSVCSSSDFVCSSSDSVCFSSDSVCSSSDFVCSSSDSVCFSSDFVCSSSDFVCFSSDFVCSSSDSVCSLPLH